MEYGSGLVFRSAATLGPLYEQLIGESVLSVKAEQIASFLGHKITPQPTQELGAQFSTRIEGTCIKHRFASSSIKMYDKFGCVLRIETTTNDVSSFKHYRKVEHRQGPATSNSKSRPWLGCYSIFWVLRSSGGIEKVARASRRSDQAGKTTNLVRVAR